MHPSETRVEELFFAALDLESPDARASFLDKVCGDPCLRRRVERLLEFDAHADGFLEESTPPPKATATQGDSITLEATGAEIGPYRLLEAIGEGGMGTVYMAEQTEPVRRKVALKLIKPGMDSKQVIARFEAERQALALMDHPNIARVLDAGTTEAGRPFFVMELVRGIPITDYCDQARLSIPERLELFIQVCRAVQHAHQKGVIHRDLKPTNVLVTQHDGTPVPKVIDFGVAKATGQRLTEKTLYTGFLQLVGTPLYMSPEQAALSGVDVDTRSDIYSLGVLLYELLTGTTPIDPETLREAAFAEMCRILRDEEPPAPSTRLSSLAADRRSLVSARRHADPGLLGRVLRGELDWIVMRALEKDRSRRYETANALARDVERHLADEPVEAGPPSASYRLRKFARRHRAAFGTAAAIAAALLLAAAMSTWQAIRATRAEAQALHHRSLAEAAERQARRELGKSKLMFEFLTEDLLSQAEPEKNAVEDHITLLEVLDRAAEQVGERYQDQPELEAELREVIAKAYHGLGSWEKAERQWRAVRESAARRLGPDSAEALQASGELGHILFHRGDTAEALPLLESAAEGLERKLGAEGPETIDARNYLASAYIEMGRAAEAIELHEETLRRSTAALGPEHPDTLATRSNLAGAYRAAGRHAEAIELHEETLPLIIAALGPEHPDTLRTRDSLAVAYLDAGRVAEAIEQLEQTLPLNTAALGPEHPRTLTTRNNLAAAYWRSRRLDRSVPLFEETLRGMSATVGPDHPETLTIHANLGVNYRDAGRLEEGIRLMEQALERARRQDGAVPNWFGWVPAQLATAYERAGRHSEAEAIRREALDRARSLFGPDDPRTAGAMATLGLNLLQQGKHAEAEPLLRDCLALREAADPDGWQTANHRSILGDALLGLGRFAEAEPLLLAGAEGLEARAAAIPEPVRAICLAKAADRLARLYGAAGRLDEAARWRAKFGPADGLPPLPDEPFARHPADRDRAAPGATTARVE